MTRPDWVNLNGLWDYAIQSKEQPAPKTFDGKILVPYCVESELSGVQKPLLPSQRLWYQRIFLVEAGMGNRVLLHFGAVDDECDVWVNGKQVGEHRGRAAAGDPVRHRPGIAAAASRRAAPGPGGSVMP